MRGFFRDENKDNGIHFSVNVGRLLWTAKEKFCINPRDKTDLDPLYAIQEVKRLC